VFDAIHDLQPANESQADLKRQALTLVVRLGEIRLTLIARTATSVARPLLLVVVAWLIVIFLSFSVLAPATEMALLALMISALAVAGALLLILELDRPFQGMLMISRDTAEAALRATGG